MDMSGMYSKELETAYITIDRLKKDNNRLRQDYMNLLKEYEELKENFRKVGVHAFRNVYN